MTKLLWAILMKLTASRSENDCNLIKLSSACPLAKVKNKFRPISSHQTVAGSARLGRPLCKNIG